MDEIMRLIAVTIVQDTSPRTAEEKRPIRASGERLIPRRTCQGIVSVQIRRESSTRIQGVVAYVAVVARPLRRQLILHARGIHEFAVADAMLASDLELPFAPAVISDSRCATENGIGNGGVLPAFSSTGAP